MALLRIRSTAKARFSRSVTLNPFEAPSGQPPVSPTLTVARPQLGLHIGALADQDGQRGVGLLQLHVAFLDEVPAEERGRAGDELPASLKHQRGRV